MNKNAQGLYRKAVGLKGIGFRFEKLDKNQYAIYLGHSHPHVFTLGPELECILVDQNTKLVCYSSNKDILNTQLNKLVQTRPLKSTNPKSKGIFIDPN